MLPGDRRDINVLGRLSDLRRRMERLRGNPEAGMTLVELVVTTAILGVVLTAVMSLLFTVPSFIS